MASCLGEICCITGSRACGYACLFCTYGPAISQFRKSITYVIQIINRDAIPTNNVNARPQHNAISRYVSLSFQSNLLLYGLPSQRVPKYYFVTNKRARRGPFPLFPHLILIGVQDRNSVCPYRSRQIEDVNNVSHALRHLQTCHLWLVHAPLTVKGRLSNLLNEANERLYFLQGKDLTARPPGLCRYRDCLRCASRAYLTR